MKVLWFTNVPMPEMFSIAGDRGKGYGGHWISSLYEQIKLRDDIKLGVATAFNCLKDADFVKNGTRYFTIEQPKRYPIFSYRSQDLIKCHSAIEAFQPELIHIHGSERFYGLVAAERKSTIPIMVSFQGILAEYAKFKNYFGSLSPSNIITAFSLVELIFGLGLLLNYKKIREAAIREKNFLRKVQAVLGRTSWDKACAKLYCPQATYLQVGEILRPSFYKHKWQVDQAEKYTIIYTNAGHPRRGTEDLLEAISFLKNEFPKIKLRLAGTISERSGYGRFLRKRIRDLRIKKNIELLGYLSEEEIVRTLLSSHVFVISSYIENSPNSLAEAQIVGLPCIVSFSGGMTTMVEEKKTGLMFPTGNVPLLADCIRQIFIDQALAVKLGERARKVALDRHNVDKVTKQLINAYRTILEK